MLLGQFGLVTSSQMFRQWKFVVVGATVAAAVLTPSTDPFTQVWSSYSARLCLAHFQDVISVGRLHDVYAVVCFEMFAAWFVQQQLIPQQDDMGVQLADMDVRWRRRCWPCR